MKPENIDVVRQLLQEFQVYKLMDTCTETEWTYHTIPEYSSIDIETDFLSKAGVSALNQVTRTLWLRHNIVANWYISGNNKLGKFRITIS